jgi:small-conductance mechanosensitive channel
MAQTAQINIRVDGQQAQGSVSQLNQSLQQTEQTTGSLRAQLRQVTQELQNLEPGSARFNELTQRAGQLRDTIQDTNAVINATAGNVTENLAKGLGTMAQTGIMGFQGVMGAMALFGVESENLQKTMVALQGAMALTQALEFFGGFGDKLTEIKA